MSAPRGWNPAAYEFLEQCGCDALQGDFIAPAMAAAQVEAFVSVWNGAERQSIQVERS